ncbi:MAG: hypothetical protein ABIS31_01370 [Candidatus Eisenbacteria bacterium]
MVEFDAWVDRFTAHVAAKGKVPPGQYRAHGYKAPGHRWADTKLGIRHVRMMLGRMPDDSSPGEQHEQDLNRDATLHWKRGEGERLRKARG